MEPDASIFTSLSIPPPAASPPLFDRLRAHFLLKVLLLLLLAIIFCVPYFLIGWHPLRTPVALPLTFLDRAIPFDPQWSYLYESVYLLIPLAPLLAVRKVHIRKYIAAFLLLTVVGLAVCLFFPVRGPRPEIAPGTSGLYAVIITCDAPNNAFPSMHMALATQSLLFGAFLLRQAQSPRRMLWLTLGSLWLAVIAYSTIATRQHYALDLPAGIALGFLAHYCVFRRRT